MKKDKSITMDIKRYHVLLRYYQHASEALRQVLLYKLESDFVAGKMNYLKYFWQSRMNGKRNESVLYIYT